MSDSRMHYFDKLSYDTMDLMLTLKPGKFHKLWLLIMDYAHATEAGDGDAPIPTTGDSSVDGFLRVVCASVRDKTAAYFERVQVNKGNADKRWSKTKADQADQAKGKAAKQDNKAEAKAVKQDAPKTSAPMTFNEFEAFAGNNINGHDVRQLYDKLQSMGWVYHGHQLSEYWAKCNKCYDKRGGKLCCGMMAVVSYNTRRGYIEPVRAAAFNALCDAMAGDGRGLCDVGDAMANLIVTVDDEIRYKGKLFNSVQNFAEFLKTSEN